MKLSLFKKVCLTVMGIGVVGSLVSVGTFASFTAVTTNPGNTFAAGTLTLTNSALAATSNPLVGTGTAPQTSTNTPTGTGSDCTTAVAGTCKVVLTTTNVVASGVEPGEFVRGDVQITNAGNLPATVAMQVQNLTTSVPGCGTGALVACADPGTKIAITIYDQTNNQCLYGTASNGNVAVTGACTDITTAANLGTGGTGSAPPTGTVFGVCETPTASVCTTGPTASSLAALSGTNVSNLIFVPGNAATKSLTSTAVIPNVTTPTQWKANNSASGSAAEAHTFVITIGLVDTGLVSGGKTLGTDTVAYGNDNQFQNFSASFDLVWYAFQ